MPETLKVSLKKIKAEMDKLTIRPGRVKALLVEDSALFRQLFRQTLHERFPSVEIHEAVNGIVTGTDGG